MKNLTGKYLVDLIDWRPDINGEISDKLPSEHWIDVDMSDDFWFNNINSFLNESNTPRDALNAFLMEYIDTIYSHDFFGARIRSIDEIRDEKIDDILD